MKWTMITGKTGYFEFEYGYMPFYKLNDHEIVMIDSGGHIHPELFDDLKAMGSTVRAVMATHLHIDHIANIEELKDAFGTEVFAAHDAWQDYYTRFAALPNILQDSFFFTPNYLFDVTLLDEGQTELILDGQTFTWIDMPGHCLGHSAIVTPDGVCCVGDTLMSSNLIGSAKLPYHEDIEAMLASIDKLSKTNYDKYVLCHCAIIEHEAMVEACQKNIARESQIQQALLNTITEPAYLGDLMPKFFPALTLKNPLWQHFGYMRNTIEARLHYLEEKGLISYKDGIISRI